MPFSNRFIVLILLGVVPIILGSLIGWALGAFIIYNIILLTLLIQDFVMTTKSGMLEVSRVCEEMFSLGADNEVIIRVRNNSERPVYIEVRDEIPPFFKVKEQKLIFKVLPHGDADGSYIVVPEKRGQFRFGILCLRYHGVLGLCSKSGKYDISKLYKVYPNIKDLRRYSLASLKKSQLLLGNKRVKAFGTGTEFESLREYIEGDDYRKINWLATARSDKLVVNTYEPERNQQIFIMLDASRVMNSEINYIKKLDYAINSAFVLSDFATRKGDNVGLLVFDSEVKRFVKPGKGAAHFNLIAENLYNVEENFVTANYEGALVYLNQTNKRRSLLCIFTEVFNAEEALYMVSAIKSIAKNHLPLIITINDTRIEEAVNEEIKNTDDVFIKTSAIKLLGEREKIRKIFARSGIACIDVPPDKLSIEVLNRYLTMKTTMQL